MFKTFFFFCFIFFFVISCSHISPIKNSEGYHYDRAELVSVGSALHLALNSYLKGCVDVLQSYVDEKLELEKGEAFSNCRELAHVYMEDVFYIMDQKIKTEK